MTSRRSWRNRLLVGTLSTLVVSGAGLALDMQPAHALNPVTVTRIAGADRFTTARQTAEAAFPGGATEAVLARGDLFPDALAGSYLAGQDAAPILLTTSASLHPQALLGLNNLNVTTVHILGSEAAISQTVATELVAAGFTVDRIGGNDRFDTAANVALDAGAAAVGTLPGFGKTAFVASGRNFPDALAAGPLSFHDGFPILLTDPNALPGSTSAALNTLGIQHVILVGGTGAVSDSVKSAIEALGITVDRRFGPDRFATAANLADFARDTLGFAVDALILATGANFPDAVAAGPLGGVREAPIVLTADPLPDPSKKVCQDNQPTVTKLFPMGGPGVVSDAAVDTCKGLAEGAPPPPPANLAGYVWADEPASASYTPSPTYQFNSSGGTNTITRSATGSYTVTFPGLGVNEGTVAVTAYGTNGNECHVQNWNASGTDLRVNVRCFNPIGVAADNLFTASFQRRVAGSGPAAYLWANEPGPGAPYNPSAAYSFNSTGAANIVDQTATGVYSVTLPGLGTNRGHVQVTGYGSTGNVCKVQSWAPNGSDESITVRCFDAVGAPVDSRFTIQFVNDINFLPIATPSGFVWANDSANPSYDPSPTYSFNSAGNVNHITRTSAGVYNVSLPGVGSTHGTVHVTAYGTSVDQCNVQGWGTSGNITVRCFNTGGGPTDSRFTLSWTA